jgi:hypothetical protein
MARIHACRRLFSRMIFVQELEVPVDQSPEHFLRCRRSYICPSEIGLHVRVLVTPGGRG